MILHFTKGISKKDEMALPHTRSFERGTDRNCCINLCCAVHFDLYTKRSYDIQRICSFALPCKRYIWAAFLSFVQLIRVEEQNNEKPQRTLETTKRNRKTNLKCGFIFEGFFKQFPGLLETIFSHFGWLVVFGGWRLG